jgi:hypothetical protein
MFAPNPVKNDAPSDPLLRIPILYIALLRLLERFSVVTVFAAPMNVTLPFRSVKLPPLNVSVVPPNVVPEVVEEH